MFLFFSNSDGTFETIALRCPACDNQLVRQVNTPRAFIYCANGQCDNQACNDGAHGKDIESAHAQLVNNYEGKELSPTTPNFENTLEAFLMRD